MFKQILGVRVDNLTNYMAQNRVVEFLNNSKQNTIFTPNPEILLKASRDDYFKNVLNSSSLNICDSFGLSALNCFALNRISGADFMLKICELAEKFGEPVFLLGTQDLNIVRRTAVKLIELYPNLKIADLHEGPAVSEVNGGLGVETEINNLVKERIRRSDAKILFVAFGQGKQEKWITENLRDLPNIKIAMAVGGTFDFLGGKVKRAPRFLRSIGVEWFWRLIQEPARKKRIWNAVAVFPFVYIKTKIKNYYD